MTCVRAATFNLLTAATFNQLTITTFFVASSDSDVYVCLVCCQIYLACRSLLLLYYPAPAPTRVGVVVVRARLRPTPTLVLVQEQSKRDKYIDTVQAMGIMRVLLLLRSMSVSSTATMKA